MLVDKRNDLTAKQFSRKSFSVLFFFLAKNNLINILSIDKSPNKNGSTLLLLRLDLKTT